MAARFEMRSPKRGQYTWVLSDRGRTLAVGATYTRKASCEKAIASFRNGASTAAVADLTEPAKPALTARKTAARKTAAKAAKAAKTTTTRVTPAKRAGGARKKPAGRKRSS